MAVACASTPIRVAIVGAGPSGFYAAEALLRSSFPCEVTVIERLPTPYGLVRSGVAPDHPKLKQTTAVFERITQLDGFNFVGGVEVGRTISIQDLQSTHHSVILAYGASEDQRMDIPGEDLLGSYAAREFVGWYNGHPDYRKCSFDLGGEIAVIIGQGNVALDVARILSKPVDALRSTDISTHALEVLAESRVKEVYVVGRRGPAQAKFTSAELREFGSIPDCIPVVRDSDLHLNEASEAEAADRMSRTIATNLEILHAYSANPQVGSHKRCHFAFYLAPKVILGDAKVSGIAFAKTVLTGLPFSQRAILTDDEWTLPCQLVFRSVGYRGTPMQGVPFDIAKGLLPNQDGRITDSNGMQVTGLYATGWIKRGPTGIIGTNRADSLATVQTLLSDMNVSLLPFKSGALGLRQLLAHRDIRFTSLSDWRRIDAAEVALGRERGKPREKLTSIREMLTLCEPLPAYNT